MLGMDTRGMYNIGDLVQITTKRLTVPAYIIGYVKITDREGNYKMYYKVDVVDLKTNKYLRVTPEEVSWLIEDNQGNRHEQKSTKEKLSEEEIKELENFVFPEDM